MNKKTLFSIIAVLVIAFLFFSRTNAWENTKLRLTTLWGFFTLGNNPLLRTYDKDLANRESDSRVSLDLLLSGGPPKDGIPSIDEPKFVSAEETSFEDSELVIGVHINGEARAYPYGILNWHEIVNDKIGNTPVSVTLCPLCDTNPVFIRRVNGQETTFGVSGKLFQSCLVMYDRLTDSLWSQPWGLGVVGENVNNSLERVPSQKTTLGQWKKLHPETKVLSEDTGFRRNYFRYPYGTFYTDDTIIFPVRNQENRQVHPKEIESYIWNPDKNTPQNLFSGESIHFTHKELEEIGNKTFLFNGEKIEARWNEQLGTIQFFTEDETEVPSSTAFGFVYPAFFEYRS